MIKILVLNSDVDGVGYFRCLSPNLYINEDDIKVDVRLLSDSTLPLIDPNFIQKYDIIFYNKVIPFADAQREAAFYQLCDTYNIKLVYDLDDYWILDQTHLNYKRWKQNNSQETIERIISRADVVTTTTPIFAEKIRDINPNVEVLPNCVNLNEDQWVSKKYESDKTRFIWGGGISHEVDLRLLKQSFKKFNKTFLENSQMIMCGYDLRMKMQDGSITKCDPKTSQWTTFEHIFTNNGIYVKNSAYREFLNTSSNFDNDTKYGRNEKFINEFYQRRHTKPIMTYGTMYNEADVALAPLKNSHTFNNMKSQLKLIEAGAHKCPIIMSNYGPYTLDDLEGALNGTRKGFYVDESVGDWHIKMKYYLDNPNAIIDHGEANYEYVKNNYSSEVVGKKRVDLYREIASQDRKKI